MKTRIASCPIISQESITDRIQRLVLHCPEIAGAAKPGQFVHVRVHPSWDPLLRRPFSVHAADRKNGSIALLYRVIGKGTAFLRSLGNGASVNLMGPLGNGFRLDQSRSRALVMAGGLGSAPAFFLIDRLLEYGRPVIFMWGTRSAEEIFGLDRFRVAGVEIHLATDDGSLGRAGTVTGLLEAFLRESKSLKNLEGFVCGPEPMLAAVQALVAGKPLRVQACLEERMACGTGVCQGCAVRMQSGLYRMVCSDGPVFPIEEVDFGG
ncbi:dihydroorotate dehydrogenase electron transfer subunit [bacterium]|nr:dihydroorotate dehydrogenase electron transfer subunit [bacterium]